MKLYNSLGKEMQEFESIEKSKVIMYVCGLTPYDNAHIGHARTYISFDLVKRYLTKKGYHIFHVQNITDVEDKIINRAKKLGVNPIDLAQKYQEKANVVFDKLNILRADEYPKVSTHIKEINEMVEKIIENGYGYDSEDGVYFEVSKFQEYGKLSGQKLDSIKKGARIEINENKKNAEDFALWKKGKEIVEFESSWGIGRPGWHIECSAMSMKYSKGRTLDIHGGGRDLTFPHHENEIAQSESALKTQFSKYWMHTGFLTVNSEKMSKSLGNFVTVEKALEKFSPLAIRMFFIQSHYRSPVDYNEEKIIAAGEAAKKIFTTIRAMDELFTVRVRAREETKEDLKFQEKTLELIDEFYTHMDDDFNTPEALSSLFQLISEINSDLNNPYRPYYLKLRIRVKEIVRDILGLEEQLVSFESKFESLNKLMGEMSVEFGVKFTPSFSSIKEECVKHDITQMIELRNRFRKEKKYKESDLIRDRLKEIGIVLEDKDGKTNYILE